MSLKVLGQGSTEPPLAPGVLRVYGHRFCPYTHRTLLVLHHKNHPHEVVNIDVKNKPDWYFKKLPLGNVPVIEVDGKVLHESIILADYADAVSGESLWPKDPFQKALDKIIVERTSLFPILKVHFEKNKRALHFQNFAESVLEIDEELANRGTKFLGGDSPGFADYMFWPFFHHFLAISAVFPDLKLPPTKTMEKYIADMQLVPAVQKTVDTKLYSEFLRLYMEGSYQFDIGL